MTAIEAKAKTVGEDSRALLARLMEAKGVLHKIYQKLFSQNRFDFARKRLVSDDGKHCLQWKSRPFPHLPVSYSNQQTSTGVVQLLQV